MRTMLLVALILTLHAAAAHSADVRPNILFIAVDDMNDWISPLGGRAGVITPNLDRLAAMGMNFTNAHTAAAACHPSRVAIMTGVRPTTSGITKNVFNNTPGPSWRNRPVLKDAITLSQHFRDHGYRAAGGGKIYHALQWWDGSENDPATWDEYFPDANHPIPTQVRAPGVGQERPEFFGKRPLRNGYFGWAPIPIADEQMSDAQVVDWAITELNRKHDRPFFLAAGLFRPHIPWEVPQKYFDMYPLEQIRLPEVRSDDLADSWDHGRRWWHQWVLQNDQWRQAVQGYLASITFADVQLGRLLDGLDSSPVGGSTIVVLWSDHGFHIGEKENWEKFTVWEESTRVPLFIVAPGVTKPGSRCDRPVSLLDVYPTLAELTATLPPQQQLAGESLVPLLRDPTAARTQPAITTHDRNHGVRTDRWRYIYNGPDSGLEELYDHQADPHEFTNRAYDPQFAEVLNRHRALLQQYTGVSAPGGQTPPDDYRRNPDGTIRKVAFTPLTEVVRQAIAAHADGEPIPVIGERPGPPSRSQ